MQAREIAPAIIFIDEIDAIGRTRGGSQGNNERDQTLNMLLTELDGFEEDTGVIIMGATNRKDVLDPALIRPGRFDRIILVGRPDYEGRIDILKVGASPLRSVLLAPVDVPMFESFLDCSEPALTASSSWDSLTTRDVLTFCRWVNGWLAHKHQAAFCNPCRALLCFPNQQAHE